MNILDEREVDTRPSATDFGLRRAWARDAEHRCRIAQHNNEDFFDDPTHVARVEKTKEVVKKFFNGARLYVNQRGINRKPFTVVKVEKPLFPNHLTQAQKDAMLYGPLAELEVEVVFAKGSNSYLFRIK